MSDSCRAVCVCVCCGERGDMLIATVFSLACVWLLIIGRWHLNRLCQLLLTINPERFIYSQDYLLELSRLESQTAAQISPL